ncbi:MAG: glycosyltransferase [Anaerolineae bacterium]
MRICVLTSVHDPFDPRIFYREARALAGAGHDVILIAPGDFSEQVRDGVRILGAARPTSRWGRPRTWLSLLRHAIRLDPDVIHVHDPELLLLVPLLRVRLGKRVRLIYDVHEYFIDSIAHKVWIPPVLRKPAAQVVRVLERALGRGVDGLVFAVDEQAPLYDKWRARKQAIHNYPEVRIFADPRPLTKPMDERYRLAHFGSLYERRGIMEMLEALPRVIKEVPDTLLILGGKFESAAFEKRVQAFLRDRGLSQHVKLVGWVDHTRVRDYLASADVAWLPGLKVQQYQNWALSTKLLECMLMGLPIVSADLPYHRTFIEKADCGLMVPGDDPAAHAEALIWLYHHPEERRAMGARGRRLVLENYTWERESEKLIAFYEALSYDGR